VIHGKKKIFFESLTWRVFLKKKNETLNESLLRRRFSREFIYRTKEVSKVNNKKLPRRFARLTAPPIAPSALAHILLAYDLMVLK
jgi:hypothetical protein